MPNETNTSPKDYPQNILGGNIQPSDVDSELRSVLGDAAVDALPRTQTVRTEAEPEAESETPRPTEADLAFREAQHLAELNASRAGALAQSGAAEATVHEEDGTVRIAQGTIIDPGEMPRTDQTEPSGPQQDDLSVPDWVNGDKKR